MSLVGVLSLDIIRKRKFCRLVQKLTNNSTLITSISIIVNSCLDARLGFSAVE